MNMSHAVKVLSARQWDKGFTWAHTGSKGRRSWFDVSRDGARFRVCVKDTDKGLRYWVWVKDQARGSSFDTREDAERGMHAHIAVTSGMPLWQVNTFDRYADKGKRHAIHVFMTESEGGAFVRKVRDVGHIERISAQLYEVPGVSFEKQYRIY
jgi:hypothetical protein